MKKLLVMFVLTLSVALGGCTMTETVTERHSRINQIWEIQMRQMVEDWDYLWLIDKPTYLNAHHVRTGLPN